jgi:hypothetical protein
VGVGMDVDVEVDVAAAASDDHLGGLECAVVELEGMVSGGVTKEYSKAAAKAAKAADKAAAKAQSRAVARVRAEASRVCARRLTPSDKEWLVEHYMDRITGDDATQVDSTAVVVSKVKVSEWRRMVVMNWDERGSEHVPEAYASGVAWGIEKN